MRLSKKASNWSLAFALAAGVGATGYTIPVLADDDDSMLEEVVVTGSRIRRSNADSPTPMTVIGSNEIKGIGTTNIGELLEKLPSSIAASNQSNSTFSTTSSGLVTNALRNLNQERTLTLINGKRFVSGFNPGSGYAVDMSTIPTAMVDRIEIITGGASAVYGSDAIAGVVNIILKDDYEGVSMNVRTGVSAESDREQTDIDIAIGGNFDRGNAWMTFGYSDEEGIHARDRSFSDTDIIEADTTGDGFSDDYVYLGSSFPPVGRFGGFLGNGQPFRSGIGDQANSDRFNRASSRQLLIPIERRYAAGGISYEINDDLSIKMMLGYNETATSSDIEPVPLDLNTNIFNTDVGQTGNYDIATSLVMPELLKQNLLASGAVDLTDLGNNVTARRLVEFGDRGGRADRTTIYGNLDLDYQINDDWAVNAYASWGSNKTTLVSNGNFNVERARQALDVELVNGVVQCVDASARQAGCVPFNPFGLGTIDAAQVAYLSAATTFDAEVEQTVFGVNASGETPLELPGGRVGVAGGIEYRREEGNESPSGLVQSGIISGNAIAATGGEYDVTDYYVEARFPIIDQFIIEAAVRVGDYSTVGDLSTWKVGFDAPVLDWLRFRGTISESVRAPNITDLFAGAGETFASVPDICAGVTATSTNSPTADANCRSIAPIAARIAATGAFTLTQVETQSTGGRVGGNPNVQEETAESFTIGAVIDVPMVEGLVVAIDWYDIEIEDAIAITTRGNIVRRCFEVAASAFDPTCGGLVVRDSVGALVSVDSGSSNENNINTAGLDLDVSYNTELSDMNSSLRGNLNLSLLYNYIDEWELIGIESGIVDDRLGEILQPEHRWNLTAIYQLDDLSVTWRTRYWDEVVDSNTPTLDTFGIDTNGFGKDINTKDAIFYHDLSAGYDVTDTINVYFGINNLFDEDPETLAQGSNYGGTGINTAGEAYDVIGRRYYAGVSVEL
tara:strand:+ start:48310 stop:51189 length:2880 start_codon:yes stop_codon:yes gene_type:complete